MPVIINQIKGKLDESEDSIVKKALKYAGVKKSDILNYGINKVSLDARHQDNIHFVYSVFVNAASEKTELKMAEKPDCRYVKNSNFTPEISGRNKEGEIVIAGFGPAGMFCGLVLAEYGYKPLILERGKSVDERVESVKKYWLGGELDTESNVQFGEGGAGTFSDGKLTTRINDPLCRYVLEKFVEFGAPEEILVKAKPHIGTDNLRNIVKALREHIISLGGRILFDSRLDDMKTDNNKVSRIICNGNEIKTDAVVLAVGHSARDTFSMLADHCVFMQPKPFSVGVRIEHRQEDVDRSLYGKYAGNPKLPVGEYQLSHRRKDGRCVYTFCMCPGGHVVPAASEENTVVTNGMSEFARDGKNANAAMVVSVSPGDFGGGILDGVDFARSVEKKAFECAGGRKEAPATTVGGFLNGKPSVDSDITPTYDRGVFPCDLSKVFPEFITSMLAEGIGQFSKKMKCFGDMSAIMTAPETRTSSPVRITRTENFNSISAENLYPCGEGAGYAGGIMSAAVDGIRVALAVMKKIKP